MSAENWNKFLNEEFTSEEIKEIKEGSRKLVEEARWRREYGAKGLSFLIRQILPRGRKIKERLNKSTALSQNP